MSTYYEEYGRFGDPTSDRLTVLDDIRKKRHGVWVSLGTSVCLESGRKVYLSEVTIRCSDDYEALLAIDQGSVLPCDTLLEGLVHFLTVINAPGLYAVGSAVFAASVLAPPRSTHEEDALRLDVARRNNLGPVTIQPTEIRLAPRLTRNGKRSAVCVSALGAYAHMSDIRDIVRNQSIMFVGYRSQVVGDAGVIDAIDLEPNLAANDSRVLRYVKRKVPPGGYAPNPNKPLAARAYTKSLLGDSVHIVNAMGCVMMDACKDELKDMPRPLTLGDNSHDPHWLFSYTRIVAWRRRLTKLPWSMRDPVSLLLPGSGHLDRKAVAVAVSNHALYLAPVIRKEYDNTNKFVLLITISILWRILNVPMYAAWRKHHADALARLDLPQDAAAVAIAAEFCAYGPRVAGGAKLAIDRMFKNEEYCGMFDLARVREDAVAFLHAYAPKGSPARES